MQGKNGNGKRSQTSRRNIRLTAEGAANIHRELAEMREQKRPALVLYLQEAAAQGDLAENADYHDAREKLGYLDGRIHYLQETIADATVIEPNGSNHVAVGSTVVIQETCSDDEEMYQIVSPVEANPRDGKISYDSPVGKAVMGKKAGKKVNVQAPNGMVQFQIVAVQ